MHLPAPCLHAINLAIAVTTSVSGYAVPARLHLACGEHNDLYLALRESRIRMDRHATPADAVHAAQPGSAVLFLADFYPQETLRVAADVFRTAAGKDLRVYIEFPEVVPGLKFTGTIKPEWERLVIATETFGKRLPQGRLLMAHDAFFRVCAAQDALMVSARVAGYDHAVYGIPSSARPALLGLDGGRLLVATTRLSAFQTARHAPQAEWRSLWIALLRQLAPGIDFQLQWQPRVQPAYNPEEQLPQNFEHDTFRAAVDWHFNSGLLLTAERWGEVRSVLLKGGELVSGPVSGVTGDGRFGILEGFTSQIQHDGRQQQRAPIRADCQAESAMVLGLNWLIDKERRSQAASSNLLDFLYFNSDLCQGARGNPEHPAFGLIGWGSTAPAWTVANYGDDNARAMLASMLAAACLRSDRWDEALLRALFANLRTTGKLGFRGDRIDMPALEKHGWRHFYDAASVNYSPHFEAFSWACFLWAWRHTGEAEFLEKARSGIHAMMQVYPDKWRWNDNMERAHMLLPLAWLTRVENTPLHRKWLRQIVDDLLTIQHSTGALPERFRGSAGSHLQIPPSNEAYGTGETPLLQRNGDPVSDQLYVGGFVLLGLHEASGVLGDHQVAERADKLAAYLCRIQTRSRSLPELNGTWFRAFDFQRWEPWASSGDSGWGAWSVEAGWAQAWTTATLGLRERRVTLWELTAQSAVRKKLESVQAQMARNTGGPFDISREQ